MLPTAVTVVGRSGRERRGCRAGEKKKSKYLTHGSFPKLNYCWNGNCSLSTEGWLNDCFGCGTGFADALARAIAWRMRG